MSETRLVCETNARILVDDLDNNNYGVSAERLHEIVKHEAQRIARRVGLGEAWVSAAISLDTTNRDFTLPTTVQYANVQHLILDSRNWPMRKVPMETMNGHYMGFVPPSSVKGVPYRYTMWEDTTNTVNIRIFPIAAVADSITIFTRNQQAVLSADADLIPFSHDLLRTLEKSLAVKMWKSMSPDHRKVGPELIADFATEVEEGMAQERVRLIRMKRTDNVSLVEA